MEMTDSYLCTSDLFTYRLNTAVEELDPLNVQLAHVCTLTDLCVRIVRDDGGYGAVDGKTVGTEIDLTRDRE